MLDLYQTITEKIIASLDAGVIPWKRPIQASAARWPSNLVSKKPYRGVNVFILDCEQHCRGFDSAEWLTFNQAKSMGGMVRKGEKASMVVFWKQLEIGGTDDTGEIVKKKIPLLRHYNVFNQCQIDGIERPAKSWQPSEIKPLEACAAIVSGFKTCPDIDSKPGAAAYSPIQDRILIAPPEQFTTTESYYATLFHELVHSTGHSTRLNRPLPGDMDSAQYAKEELLADMGASFLCGHGGILPAVIDNKAAYIASWLKHLRNDKKLVISAAGAAQKAADYILGTTWSEAPA